MISDFFEEKIKGYLYFEFADNIFTIEDKICFKISQTELKKRKLLKAYMEMTTGNSGNV